MKNLIILIFMLISFFTSSCVKDYSDYTFSGRFVNGTTGKPYKNIQVDFIGHAPGYPSSKVVDLGSAITNENGEFSLKYSIESNFPGTLSVIFRNPNNPFIDLKILSEQPILQNQFQNVYLSDSGTIHMRFITNKLLNDNEYLRVYISPESDFDTTLYLKNLYINDTVLFFRISNYSNAVVWKRFSNSSTALGSALLTHKRDPFIDSVTIYY